MIVGKQKPLEEILAKLKGYSKVLIAGCGECVTVCHAGGEKEANILAEQLKMTAKSPDFEVKIQVLERQCDPEFVEEISDLLNWADAVLTLGCGAGAQTISERYESVTVIPGLNTRFIGAHTDKDSWDERCSACGDCAIHLFGGFCPITRCPKNLLNGPCGGSMEGHCEVNAERDCVWFQIIEKMTSAGKLDQLLQYRAPKDWQASRAGGVRNQKREEDLD